MPQSPQYDERKALELLASGSEYAFTQIFDQYRDNVYNVALNFLKSPLLAEEIVQDVFMKIWLKRSDMIQVEQLNNYIFIMSRNFIYDRLKKISYEEEHQKKFLRYLLATQNHTDSADDLTKDHEYRKILLEAISKLPEQQRQAYLYSREEGLSRKEIAEKMNLSPLTIKTHIARALQFIREYLYKEMPNLAFIPLLLCVIFWK